MQIRTVWSEPLLFTLESQSELPQRIPRRSVESDLGCTSRLYFDNAGDNMTLMLQNVTLTLHKVVTLMSQKPYQHNNNVMFFQ